VSSECVVVVDVICDFGAGLLNRGIGFHFVFGFESAEAGLHDCVVIAVAGTAHALGHLSSREQLSILFAGVLSASICVVNQSGGRLPVSNGVLECCDHKAFFHVQFQ